MSEKRKNEIKRWWDNPRNIRWDNFYKTDDENSFYAERRLKKTLDVLNSLGKTDLNILELGCGAGQSSERILKSGHKYKGIDISNQLIDCAKNRCKEYIESNQASFYVQSVDKTLPIEENSQDIVIIIGMLQYVDDIDFCFNEIRRVLKPNGHILICQTNMYHITEFFQLRSLLVKISYMFIHQEYEISNSIKAILLETKLKDFFKLNINSPILKYNFIKKGYIERKFDFQKRLISLPRLTKILNNYNFTPIKKTGSPFFYSDSYIFKYIAKFLELIFSLFLLIPILSLVKNIANNVIIMGKIK